MRVKRIPLENEALKAGFQWDSFLRHKSGGGLSGLQYPACGNGAAGFCVLLGNWLSGENFC